MKKVLESDQSTASRVLTVRPPPPPATAEPAAGRKLKSPRKNSVEVEQRVDRVEKSTELSAGPGVFATTGVQKKRSLCAVF